MGTLLGEGRWILFISIYTTATAKHVHTGFYPETPEFGQPKSSKFTTWYKTINSWVFFLVGGWGVGKSGRRILQQLVGLHYQNNK